MMHKLFKQLIASLIFLGSGLPMHAQPPVFAKPVAQYPLEVEGEKILRFYDVSGNGNHATVVNESNKPLDSIFSKTYFANKVACIKKISKYNAVISIPDIFKNSKVQDNGFSVSFWTYINNDQAGTAFQSGNIASTSAFSVQILRDELNAIHFSLYYPVAASPGFEFIRDETGYKKTGWYFIYISFEGSNNNNNVDFGAYYYDGNSYDPDQNAMHGTTYPGRKPLTIPKSQQGKQGTLLDQNFQGTVWDLRFFDEYLYPVTANFIRNDSWYSSQDNAGYTESARFYAVNNALSFYPCTYTSGEQLLDVFGNRNSIQVSGIDFVKDRFQQANAAIQLASNGYALLPNFFASFNKSPGFDLRKGYTISFWTYIDRFLYPPDNESIPFTEQDLLYQFYFISHPDGMLGGMGLKGDKAVINRYTNLNPLRYWNMWLWEPASFKDQKGWYQVIISQRDNSILTIIYKPDGSIGSRLNYFNVQDYAKLEFVKFGLGLSPQIKIPGSQACKYLDDIRIFNWPFSQKDADILHAFEKIKP